MGIDIDECKGTNGNKSVILGDIDIGDSSVVLE